MVKQFISEPLSFRPNLLMEQISSEQTDPAVDIKANTARGYDACFGLCRCYSTYRKTIAPVNIRHAQRIPHNAW